MLLVNAGRGIRLIEGNTIARTTSILVETVRTNLSLLQDLIYQQQVNQPRINWIIAYGQQI